LREASAFADHYFWRHSMESSLASVLPTPSQELPEREFAYRLDFYWQAIASYALALIVYALLKGTIASGSLTLELRDPIVVVLGALVVGASLFSLVNWYMRRSVTVSAKGIRFQNRFRTRLFHNHEIVAISFGRKRLTRIGGAYRVVKIRLANRRRLLRLRPSLYDNETELVQMLLQLKRELAKRQTR